MEHRIRRKGFFRKLLDYSLFAVLVLLALNQVYESFHKFIKGQSVKTFSSKPLHENEVRKYRLKHT